MNVINFSELTEKLAEKDLNFAKTENAIFIFSNHAVFRKGSYKTIEGAEQLYEKTDLVGATEIDADKIFYAIDTARRFKSEVVKIKDGNLFVINKGIEAEIKEEDYSMPDIYFNQSFLHKKFRFDRVFLKEDIVLFQNESEKEIIAIALMKEKEN